MSIITRRNLIGALEHVLAIVIGFILMVLGLGLGVTMIMLPVGLVIGLVGRCSSGVSASGSSGSRGAEFFPRLRIIATAQYAL